MLVTNVNDLLIFKGAYESIKCKLIFSILLIFTSKTIFGKRRRPCLRVALWDTYPSNRLWGSINKKDGLIETRTGSNLKVAGVLIIGASYSDQIITFI